MQHSARYAFKCQARLSADSGVHASTISRLLSGATQRPTYKTIIRITVALEASLGLALDPRELVAVSGSRYPTASLCELVGCRGCALSPRPCADATAGARPAKAAYAEAANY